MNIHHNKVRVTFDTWQLISCSAKREILDTMDLVILVHRDGSKAILKDRFHVESD